MGNYFDDMSEAEKQLLIRMNRRNKKFGERIKRFWITFIILLLLCVLPYFLILFWGRLSSEELLVLTNLFKVIMVIFLIAFAIYENIVFRCPHCDGHIRRRYDYCPKCGETLYYNPNLESDEINKNDKPVV